MFRKTSKKIFTFQEIIARLNDFWSKRGCVIQQPYDIEKGAGTMNPATFFRVLGPEPWNVAYVEPSRRPNDGRYGENPNRLSHYYQYQVIVKPAPLDIQDVYLESLAVLGIHMRDHDIRFVEDNWESPTLGAWGVGWEVWAESMEITQFTYFQQSGGFELKPISCELTYGLERIAMFIQKAPTVFDVRWNDRITYGDVHKDSEFTHSKYNFETADIPTLHEMFRLCEGEARRQAEERLVHPAYDYVLKCSHLFNLLESRHAISVAERTALIGRIRKLARQCAGLYLEGREEKGFPLLSKYEKVHA